MKTGIGLYVKDSPAAVRLYTEAFGLTLGYHVLNPDGTFYHSELELNGTEMFDVVEAGRDSGGRSDTVQIGMIMDDEAQVRRAFGRLSEGGRVDMPLCELPWSPCAASVVDRFGVWWYISAPQHRPGEDFDPASLPAGE